MRNASDKICRENRSACFMFRNIFSENRVVYAILCKITVEPDRTQVTVSKYMRIAYWVNKATNVHSENLIITAFPRQEWLHQCGLMLRLYMRCLLLLNYI